MRRRAWPTLLIATLCCGVAACEQHGGGGHQHNFKPKHGGEVIELADHGPDTKEGAAVEAVHDGKAGTIKLFVTDIHQNALKIEKAPVANLKAKDGPKQLTAKGAGAQWVFTDECLKGHVGDVSFRIEIEGKPFQPTWHPPH